MPIRAPINCNNGTCRNQALPGSQYCEGCQKRPAQKEDARQHERQRYNNEPWRRWYHSKQWKKLRILCLARDPICKICGRVASTVADHIKPHRGIWSLFCDLANLQGLCKSCHDTKTATEDGGFGAPPKNQSAPVTTGETGKQFSSSSVGEDALDRALEEEI